MGSPGCGEEPIGCGEEPTEGCGEDHGEPLKSGALGGRGGSLSVGCRGLIICSLICSKDQGKRDNADASCSLASKPRTVEDLWTGEIAPPVEGGGSVMAGRGALVGREESVWGRDLKVGGMRKPGFRIYLFWRDRENIYHI